MLFLSLLKLYLLYVAWEVLPINFFGAAVGKVLWTLYVRFLVAEIQWIILNVSRRFLCAPWKNRGPPVQFSPEKDLSSSYKTLVHLRRYYPRCPRGRRLWKACKWSNRLSRNTLPSRDLELRYDLSLYACFLIVTKSREPWEETHGWPAFLSVHYIKLFFRV